MNSIPEKKIVDDSFFFTQFVLSHAFDNATSPNIGEDGYMGRPPTSNFGVTVPPVPLKLRPWSCSYSSRRLFNVQTI